MDVTTALEDLLVDTIIDRGRGPEIAGTRITVYDILDYTTMNWHHTAIAAMFRISSRQVLAAVQYIEDHKDEVMAEYQKQTGNAPELFTGSSDGAWKVATTIT